MTGAVTGAATGVDVVGSAVDAVAPVAAAVDPADLPAVPEAQAADASKAETASRAPLNQPTNSPDFPWFHGSSGLIYFS